MLPIFSHNFQTSIKQPNLSAHCNFFAQEIFHFFFSQQWICLKVIRTNWQNLNYVVFLSITKIWQWWTTPIVNVACLLQGKLPWLKLFLLLNFDLLEKDKWKCFYYNTYWYRIEIEINIAILFNLFRQGMLNTELSIDRNQKFTIASFSGKPIVTPAIDWLRLLLTVSTLFQCFNTWTFNFHVTNWMPFGANECQMRLAISFAIYWVWQAMTVSLGKPMCTSWGQASHSYESNRRSYFKNAQFWRYLNHSRHNMRQCMKKKYVSRLSNNFCM